MKGNLDAPQDGEMLNWKHSEGTRRFINFLRDSIEETKTLWIEGAYQNEDHTVEMRKQAAARAQAQGYLKILEWIDNIKLPDKEQKSGQ